MGRPNWGLPPLAPPFHQHISLLCSSPVSVPLFSCVELPNSEKSSGGEGERGRGRNLDRSDCGRGLSERGGRGFLWGFLGTCLCVFQSPDVTMVLSMPATRQLGARSTTAAAVFANSALGERSKAGPCHVLLPSSSSAGLRSSSQFVADRQYNAGLQPVERRPGSTHVLNCTSYSTSSSSQARVSSWQDESPVVLNVSCSYPLFAPLAGRGQSDF